MSLRSCSIVLMMSVLACLGCSRRDAQPIHSFEQKNEAFAMRIVSYKEISSMPQAFSGFYYVLESRSGGEAWREVHESKVDDPLRMTERNLVFLDPKTGFAYFGQDFLVTRDEGRTFHVWRGYDYAFESRRISFDGIKNVEMTPSGDGSMRVELSGTDNPLVLYTRDFGVTWNR